MTRTALLLALCTLTYPAYADGPSQGLSEPVVTPPVDVCERQLIPNTNVYYFPGDCVPEESGRDESDNTSSNSSRGSSSSTGSSSDTGGSGGEAHGNNGGGHGKGGKGRDGSKNSRG